MSSQLKLIVLAGAGLGLLGCHGGEEPATFQEVEQSSIGRQTKKIAGDRRVRKPEHPVLKKLESMIIPVIDFNNTTLEEAIDFLRIRSIELDPEPEMQNRGVSFVYGVARTEEDAGNLLGDSQDVAGRQFSYYAEKINFLDALIEISKLSGTDLYHTSMGFVCVSEGRDPKPHFRKGAELLKVIRKSDKGG